MPLINGIDVGMEIRKNDKNCFIIYLTTSPEFALKSYQVSAYQYLLKPVSKDSLFHELEEIRKRKEFESSQRISVKTKDGAHFIPLHRIVFAEYISHRVVYHRTNDETITGSVSRRVVHELIRPLLNDPRFIAVTRLCYKHVLCRINL
jgi:DNA-binding LytR/AlgR family response regulator